MQRGRAEEKENSLKAKQVAASSLAAAYLNVRPPFPQNTFQNNFRSEVKEQQAGKQARRLKFIYST